MVELDSAHVVAIWSAAQPLAAWIAVADAVCRIARVTAAAVRWIWRRRPRRRLPADPSVVGVKVVTMDGRTTVEDGDAVRVSDGLLVVTKAGRTVATYVMRNVVKYQVIRASRRMPERLRRPVMSTRG